MSADTKPEAKPKREKKPAPPVPAGCEALLGKAQVCAALGISLRTFQSMMASGDYPKPDIRLGAFPRWRVASHNAWIEARTKKR